jgi:hypothetical protein
VELAKPKVEPADDQSPVPSEKNKPFESKGIKHKNLLHMSPLKRRGSNAESALPIQNNF